MDNAWSVWMYEQLDKKQYSQIQEKARTYILLMNILYVGFISLAPDVIHIAGTKEYYHGISMIIPLSYAIYFIFLYSLPVHIEYFYKKTKYIAIGTSIAAVINISLNYFFMWVQHKQIFMTLEIHHAKRMLYGFVRIWSIHHNIIH